MVSIKYEKTRIKPAFSVIIGFTTIYKFYDVALNTNQSKTIIGYIYLAIVCFITVI